MDDRKKRIIEGIAALKTACRKSHLGGPGGSVICICGAACGGSQACSALSLIKNILKYSKSGEYYQDELKILREYL